MAIEVITITTNPKTRESRLFKSSWEHVRKSAVALLNAFTMYKPYVVFFSVGTIFLIIGAIPFIHYIYIFFANRDPYGAHHLQSLIIGTVLLNISFLCYALGVIANLIRVNRSLIEDVLEEQRRSRYGMLIEKKN